MSHPARGPGVPGIDGKASAGRADREARVMRRGFGGGEA